MCLIFFAYENHEKYKLILSANRDEYYERPTESARFWPDNPDILAGRDLKMMGTWLGTHKNGRFAAITNYRDRSSFLPTALSRGSLTFSYLCNDANPEEYLLSVQKKKNLFNGFNLLVGNLDALCFYSNKEDSIKKIRPGVYGLSNHLLDTPWPKVREGKKLFNTCIQGKNIDPGNLFEIMTDNTRPKDCELPSTGVGMHKERMLAPIFIKDMNYGTRSTTILMIDYDGQLHFIERTYYDGISNYQDQEYRFKIE